MRKHHVQKDEVYPSLFYPKQQMNNLNNFSFYSFLGLAKIKITSPPSGSAGKPASR
jgi:hypothetical protein